MLNSLKIVLPLARHLLEINFAIVLFYAIIGTAMFGGDINSETEELFKKMTNSDMDPNLTQFNFNDLGNSF
jgi:hypothetical protein